MPAFPCPFSGEQRLQLCADGCVCMYIIAMGCVGKGVRTGRRLDLCSMHVCSKEQRLYFPSSASSLGTASCAWEFDLLLRKWEAEEVVQH